MSKQRFCVIVSAAIINFAAQASAQILPEDLSKFVHRGSNFESAVQNPKIYEPPNEEQKEFLEDLTSDKSSLEAFINNSGIDAGRDVMSTIKGESDGTVARFSLRLDPELDKDAAIEAFERNGLLITDAAEDYGVVSASKLLSPKTLDQDSSEYTSAYEETIQRLREDSSFLTVAPELNELQGMEVASLELSIGPMPFGDDDLAMEAKQILGSQEDWGLENIRAPALWTDELAGLGKAIGVLDVGFSLHQDLPLWDPPANLPVADHGNHVSGIICAKHDGKGIRGVLPLCLLVARTPKYSELPDQFGVKPDSMAAVLNAFSEIVNNHDEIKAVNISLGYNWRKRFGIEILDDQTKQKIADIASLMVPIYKAAKDRDIFIVSAAGNDSWGLEDKLNAVWASPINFASLVLCESEGLCNGVVVEAHDADDKPADFSNIGGHISCPGVDILSAVAYDEMKIRSNKHYALSSGTSMASPYCAGGLVLLSLVRPGYSVPELIACAKNSGRLTKGFNARALDLVAASQMCPLK